MKTVDAVKKLKELFPQAIASELIFLGETTLEVQKEHVKDLLVCLKQVGFEVLMDFTGVDYIVPEKKTKVIYWLHNPTNFERLRIIIFVPRDGSLPTVTDLWEGADWYERELYDLFGIS